MELTSKGQGKKIDRRRRSWTIREEEVLIAALKDIVSKGWKCENGFRTGYLKLLERSMLKAFPSTDIRAEPHINSKLHVWKKFHGSLASMLGVCGITWNDLTKMIDAQDDAWELYVKVNTFFWKWHYISYSYLYTSLSCAYLILSCIMLRSFKFYIILFELLPYIQSVHICMLFSTCFQIKK